MKILIEIHCFNRKTITEIVLNQLFNYRHGTDIQLINDHSTEYDNDWLKQWGRVIKYPKKSNINVLKYRTLKNFLLTDYTHLYMCDNDAYHDPSYIDMLIKLHIQSKGLPVTLYRSSFITSFGFNVSRFVENIPHGEIKSGLCGGISVFLSREHVVKIVESLSKTEEEWELICEKEAWDSKWQRVLGGKYAIPFMSYVEHYGAGGKNHKDFYSDYALNPTPYLKNTYDSIKNKLI